MALPVERGQWLVAAVGLGDRRPPRDPDGFAAFVAALPDPALSAVLRSGEPLGEVAVHRQTGNRRHRYGELRDWPDGLLALGDALCCFDPVYGQGITVAACQALLLRAELARALAPSVPDGCCAPSTGSRTSPGRWRSARTCGCRRARDGSPGVRRRSRPGRRRWVGARCRATAGLTAC